MKRVARGTSSTSQSESISSSSKSKNDLKLPLSDDLQDKARASIQQLRSTAFWALLLPFLILIYLCGRIGLLALSLGGIVCYLFDLIQLPEITIICIGLTLLILTIIMMSTLLNEVRQSWLNFSFLPVYALLVFLTFWHTISHFNMAWEDFSPMTLFFNRIFFMTIPLLAATIIAIFLCQEIEELDLPTSFTIVYAIYYYFLCRPRTLFVREVVSGGSSSGSSMRVGKKPSIVETVLLPRQPVVIGYFVPLVISPLVHIALHHNVLGITRRSASSFAQAILLPCIVMIVCYKSHVKEEGRKETSSQSVELSPYWDHILLATIVLYSLSILDHPICDDLREFGGLGDPLSEYVLRGCVLAVHLSIFFIRKAQQYQALEEQDGVKVEGFWIAVNRVAMAISVGLVASLLGLLIGLSDDSFPFALFGAVMLGELYFQKWSLSHQLILALLSSLALLKVLLSIFKRTLYTIAFTWTWHIDLTMKDFSHFLIIITVFYTLLPVTLDFCKGLQHDRVGLLGNVDSNDLGSNMTAYDERRKFFSLAFIALSLIIASFELMVMEQRWDTFELIKQDIYPDYFFFTTSSILSYVAYKLYRKRVVPMVVSLLVIGVQLFKLLHYVHWSSWDIASFGFVVITTILPFLMQLVEYFGRDALDGFEKLSFQGNVEGVKPSAAHVSLSPGQIAFLVCLNTLSIYYFGPTVAKMILEASLNKSATLFQVMCCITALWCIFMSSILLVFYRSARLWRSAFFASGVALLITSFEGFGSLTLSRFSSTTPSTNDDHSFVFMILSSAMTVIAWSKVIPVVDTMNCLVYSLLYSFASTKAMLSWALPSNSISSILHISHDIRAFPFIALYLGKATNTFTVMWSSSNDRFRHPFFPYVLAAAVAWPFLALMMSMALKYPPALHHGIIWSTIANSAMTCGSFRAQEVLALIRGQRSTHAMPSKYGEISLILLLALLSLVWTLLVVVYQISSIDNDVLFPVIALLLLCEDASFLPYRLHPLAVWAIVCTAWWYGSAVYHIFLRGLGDGITVAGVAPYSIFGWDEEVSIWVNTTPYLSILNAVLAILPFPAIYASMTKSQGVTQEVVFVLAIVSMASIIGGSIDCVRYLGLVGAVSAGYRCYMLSSNSRTQNSII